MPAPIDFYFDYSSPYGYFAAMKIDDLAAKHGRSVNWKPILLGAVFKVTGGQPLPTLPLKGPYALRDILRSARFYGVAYKHPIEISDRDPGAGARVLLGERTRSGAREATRAGALSRVFRRRTATFRARKSRPTWPRRSGLKRDDVLAALNDPAVKDKLKNEVDAAIKLGVFGSPYIVIDGEPFWGIDRFDQIERWLARGPF